MIILERKLKAKRKKVIPITGQTPRRDRASSHSERPTRRLTWRREGSKGLLSSIDVLRIGRHPIGRSLACHGCKGGEIQGRPGGGLRMPDGRVDALLVSGMHREEGLPCVH